MIAGNGAMTEAPGFPFMHSTINGPLCITIDPAGAFLYVGNAQPFGNALAGFSINATSAALTPLANSPFNAMPVSIGSSPTEACSAG